MTAPASISIKCGKPPSPRERLTAEAAATSMRRSVVDLRRAGFRRDRTGTDAGRGIGLDAVRDIVSRQCGRIRVGATRGEYCHFRVQFALKKIQPQPSPFPEPIKEAA